MKKISKILMIVGLAVWLALYQLWNTLGDEYWFIGQSFMILCVSLAITYEFRNGITIFFLFLAINQFIDEITYNNTNFNLGEYIASFLVLVFVCIMKFKRNAR